VPPAAPTGAARPTGSLARTAGAALRAIFGPRAPRAPPPLDLDALAVAARERDYFELVGVPRTCSSEEARRAADALLDRLGEPGDGAPPDPTGQLADVRQVALDARDVLGEDALREAYAKAIAAPTGEAAGPVARPSGE
jgi:hypothetical protein